MSDIDLKSLEALFVNWHKERAPKLDKSSAFERFAVEQILKDLVPTDEDLDVGDLGGGDDGGVDAMHLVMNGSLLIADDTDVPKPTTSVELILIQAKAENGYSETAVQKIQHFCADLFDYSKEPSDISYINQTAREAIARFRSKYGEVMGQAHSIAVTIHYVTKAEHNPLPHEKVSQRVDNLKSFINTRLSQAKVELQYWGCARLLSAAREIPKLERVLEITNHFSLKDTSVVCLATLTSFARFLTDEHGRLRSEMLEPNVRDYQGIRNTVNGEIRQTLIDRSASEEFWWLNNGVTILAERASVSGDKLQMTSPEIVNGLQTSSEVFGVFASGGLQSDPRSILVRVIVSTDDLIRDKVIKATNNQTPVDPLSLRATDRVHFDIEDRLKLFNLFYDRKKGKYKRLRKPIADIVGMKSLSQAVMAIAIGRPSDARARPGTVLKDEGLYSKLFDDGYSRDLYVVCVLIDRQVDAFLGEVNIPRDQRRDLRYFVDALLARELAKSAAPTTEAIASLVSVARSIDPLLIRKVFEVVRHKYFELGGNDKVAKGAEFWPALLKTFEV